VRVVQAEIRGRGWNGAQHWTDPATRRRDPLKDLLSEYAGLQLLRTAVAADSSLARIVHIVEEAQERKGAGQRLADRIARPLVPGIMLLAVAIALVGSLLDDPRLWIERALIVLVAASPCALGIAVPLTVVAAIGAASRTGALARVAWRWSGWATCGSSRWTRPAL
jgi:magnesium-transporting ATPase (P-type)